MWNLGALDLGLLEANTRERLDRFLVSPKGRILYGRAGVIHLLATRSNHAPILLWSILDHEKALRPFRFLEVWTHDPSCELVINEAWSEAQRNGRRISLTAKLFCTVKALKSWTRKFFKFYQSKIKSLEEKIGFFQSLEPS